MRLLTTSILALGFALLASQASATPAIFLEYNGGEAQQGAGACLGDDLCAAGESGDTLILNIMVSMEEGDTVTGAFASVDFNSSGGSTLIGGTEESFWMVGGVLLTPIGTPGADIAYNDPLCCAENMVKGWEAQTLSPSGAPGPATFQLGTITFQLGGGGSFFVEIPPQFVGMQTPTNTVFGAADFEDITDQITRGQFALEVVPEPSGTLLMAASLGTMGFLVRRRAR